MRLIADSLIATLFAPVCACCERVLDTPSRSPVCDACWRKLGRYTPPWCYRCGIPLARAEANHACLAEGGAIAALRALGPYEGVLRGLVHALKFDRRRSLARPLGGLLCSSAADVFDGADALVPVPLHPWRQWRRGFNQVDDLAHALRSACTAPTAPVAPIAPVAPVAPCDIPVWPALRRRRATRPQSELDASARRANVRDAFTLGGRIPWRRASWAAQISGRTLVLVDDVTTTGATLEECADVLHRHGAREVRAVTIGRVMLG